MAVRSRRLFGPLIVNVTVATTIYTVPAGRTAIIRALYIWNRSDLTNAVGRLHINGSSSSLRILDLTMAVDETRVYENIVLDPGDTLVWTNPGVAGAYVLAGFGSLLLGAPE